MTLLSRRTLIQGLGASVGSLAIPDAWGRKPQIGWQHPTPEQLPLLQPPISQQPISHRAKATAVIVLFMEGGPSHLDTFDPKPILRKWHLGDCDSRPRVDAPPKVFLASPFTTRKVGQSGIDMCAAWKHLAASHVADELCLYRGCCPDSASHPQALLGFNIGSQRGTAGQDLVGQPALGSWVAYGLETDHQDVPAFAVMTDPTLPQAGPANWSHAFLPERCRAAHIHPASLPKFDPTIVDLRHESELTRRMYGIDRQATKKFGEQCLRARRLVENGARFVQLYSGGWDSHDLLHQSHASRIASVDQPIAALIHDLKQRGMLDQTLVVWTGEFGRSPESDPSKGTSGLGRDHNANAMSMWFAGGGTKRGAIVGATDEVGASAVQCVHRIRDVHATILHLLGLDQAAPACINEDHPGQCSLGGEVIKELLA